MATKYMSPSGNDSTGDGSIGNPYLTITKAIAMTTTGDTIYLLSGNYTTTNFPASTINNRTIYGAGQNSSIIDYTGAGSTVLSLSGTTTLCNLQIKNVLCTYGSPIRCADDSIVTISCCTLNRLRSQGDYIDYAVIGLQRNTGYKQGAHITVSSCLIINPMSNGATYAVFAIRGSSSELNLYNNVIYMQEVGPATITKLLYYGGDSGSIVSAAYLRSKNNIIYNNTGYSIGFKGVYGTGETLITTVWQNNDVVGISSSPTGSGNITSDPLFVDAANSDFRLRPTSPCIGTGTIV